MIRSSCGAVPVLLLLAAGVCAGARGADSPVFQEAAGGRAGISVAGAGAVPVPPAVAHVLLRVVASAEDSTDAMAKLQDRHRLIEKEFELLEIPGIETKRLGPVLRVQPVGGDEGRLGGILVFGEQPEGDPDLEVVASEVLAVKIQGSGDLPGSVGRVVDAALKHRVRPDSGSDGADPAASRWLSMISGGRPSLAPGLPPVRYEGRDPAASVRQATALAFADARAKAESLASLAGVALGPLESIAVEEGPAYTEAGAAPFEQTVKVSVRFAIGRPR